MSEEETTTNAKHLATKEGDADHGGYASAIAFAYIMIGVLFVLVIALASSAYSRPEEIWKALGDCPSTHQARYASNGDFKDCIKITDLTPRPKQ